MILRGIYIYFTLVVAVCYPTIVLAKPGDCKDTAAAEKRFLAECDGVLVGTYLANKVKSGSAVVNDKEKDQQITKYCACLIKNFEIHGMADSNCRYPQQVFDYQFFKKVFDSKKFNQACSFPKI